MSTWNNAQTFACLNTTIKSAISIVVNIHGKFEKLPTRIEIITKLLKRSKRFVKLLTRVHDGTLPRWKKGRVIFSITGENVLHFWFRWVKLFDYTQNNRKTDVIVVLFVIPSHPPPPQKTNMLQQHLFFIFCKWPWLFCASRKLSYFVRIFSHFDSFAVNRLWDQIGVVKKASNCFVLAINSGAWQFFLKQCTIWYLFAMNQKQAKTKMLSCFISKLLSFDFRIVEKCLKKILTYGFFCDTPRQMTGRLQGIHFLDCVVLCNGRGTQIMNEYRFVL